MARFLLAKMASVAALISTSAILSSCQTVAYKPIICQPGTMLKDGRCQKVTKAKTQPNKPSKPKSGGANSNY